MTTLWDILRSLAGLFVDDEFLAVGVLAVVTVTAALVLALGVQPLFAGGFLLVGCVAVLIAGATRTARRKS